VGSSVRFADYARGMLSDNVRRGVAGAVATATISASAQATASKAARKPSNMEASAASSFSAEMMNAIGEGIARILKTSPRNVEPAASEFDAGVNSAAHVIK
jgi:hypothetical protein